MGGRRRSRRRAEIPLKVPAPSPRRRGWAPPTAAEETEMTDLSCDPRPMTDDQIIDAQGRLLNSKSAANVGQWLEIMAAFERLSDEMVDRYER
jgi:hypothetical protein